MSTKTTPAPSPTTTAKPKRRKPQVAHYYMLPDYDAAVAMGLREVLSTCRRKWLKIGKRHDFVDVWDTPTGGQVVEGQPRDCKLCLAAYRREVEGMSR